MIGVKVQIINEFMVIDFVKVLIDEGWVVGKGEDWK